MSKKNDRDREAALEQRLRENLKRRKQQSADAYARAKPIKPGLRETDAEPDNGAS